MKKVFLDTNILIYYVDNEDYRELAEIIVELGRVGKIELYASYLSFANMAYVFRKKTVDERFRLLNMAKGVVTVLPCDSTQLDNALKVKVKDFEDVLQFQCAKSFGCDALITNNKKDFTHFTDISIFTPEEFLLNLSL
ncbi:MAG: PIN domain-containing protein [Bacteroidales bacterium]|nr:PIN domain-containing protein [Bacteroidales bacterium]